jgi:hypothetical protein
MPMMSYAQCAVHNIEFRRFPVRFVGLQRGDFDEPVLTNRHGAMRRLMEIRYQISGLANPSINVVGLRRDGEEVSGVESALLNLRAGRLMSFSCSGATDEHVVFIS